MKIEDRYFVTLAPSCPLWLALDLTLTDYPISQLRNRPDSSRNHRPHATGGLHAEKSALIKAVGGAFKAAVLVNPHLLAARVAGSRLEARQHILHAAGALKIGVHAVERF